MFTFSQFVDALIKGHGHRYIKRIPYMTPKGRRYRYIYKVTHSHKGKQAIHEDHLDVGTKFMLHTESGKEVHGHIKSVDGDKVTYVIDDGADKGKEVTGTKAEILAMLNEKHGVEEKLREKRDQLKADIEQARQTGTRRQVARLEAQLKRLGGEPAKEGADKGLSKKEVALANQIQSSAKKNLDFLQRIIAVDRRKSNEYRMKKALQASVENIFNEVAKPLGLDDDYLYIAKMTPRFLNIDATQNADFFDAVYKVYENATDEDQAHLGAYHKIIEQLVDHTATHSTGGGTTAEERRNFKKLNRRFKAQADLISEKLLKPQADSADKKQIGKYSPRELEKLTDSEFKAHSRRVRAELADIERELNATYILGRDTGVDKKKDLERLYQKRNEGDKYIDGVLRPEEDKRGRKAREEYDRKKKEERKQKQKQKREEAKLKRQEQKRQEQERQEQERQEQQKPYLTDTSGNRTGFERFTDRELRALKAENELDLKLAQSAIREIESRLKSIRPATDVKLSRVLAVRKKDAKIYDLNVKRINHHFAKQAKEG